MKNSGILQLMEMGPFSEYFVHGSVCSGWVVGLVPEILADGLQNCFFINKDWGDVIIFAYHEPFGGDIPNGFQLAEFSLKSCG